VNGGGCVSVAASWDCSKPLGSTQSFAVDNQEMRRSEPGRGLASISCSMECAFGIFGETQSIVDIRFLLLRVVGVAMPTPPPGGGQIEDYLGGRETFSAHARQIV
jgi:hypothetical protein